MSLVASHSSALLCCRVFEKLAHPVYGVMTIDYRPVDCGTHTPLKFIPGYVSKYMYMGGVSAGWDWFPYQAAYSDLGRDGESLQHV